MFFLLNFFSLGMAYAKSQPNLETAQKGLKTKYGKQIWVEEMYGIKPKIVQSTIKDLTNEDIAKALLGQGAEEYHSLQLVQWMSDQNRYLLVAKKEDFLDDDCAQVILFKINHKKISLLSALPKNKILCGNTSVILFSPIALGKNKQGFSLLTNDSEIYSGGGAYESQLSLIEVINDELVLRLTTFHGNFKNIAGSWNKNGTRRHDITEESCTVSSDKEMIVNDYYVFKKHCIRSRNGSRPKTSSRVTFKYSTKKAMYDGGISNKEVSVLQKD
jgi:hypothetical protein